MYEIPVIITIFVKSPILSRTKQGWNNIVAQQNQYERARLQFSSSKSFSFSAMLFFIMKLQNAIKFY